MQVNLQTEQLIAIYEGNKEVEKELGEKNCLDIQEIIGTLEAYETVTAYASMQFLDYKPPTLNEHIHSVRVNKQLRLLFKAVTTKEIVIIGIQ